MISTKERAWYRFINNSDRYDQDRLDYDQELLREFYFSQGYADFQVLSSVAELANDRGNFFVTFTVDEGMRYRIGGTEILSDIRDFDASVLNESITFDTGDWYDADEVKKTIRNMTDQLGDLQYAFVDVRPEIERNRRKQAVKVVFLISETPRVFVERINVNGNIRTLDKVLRREMSWLRAIPSTARNLKSRNAISKIWISLKRRMCRFRKAPRLTGVSSILT